MNSAANLGMVNNLNMSAHTEAETFKLSGYTETNQPFHILMTDGAARILWADLTQALYPRAAEQLTGRAETAKETLPSDPKVCFVLDSSYDESQEVLTVRGLSNTGNWSISIGSAESHELWTTLESIFDNV